MIQLSDTIPSEARPVPRRSQRRHRDRLRRDDAAPDPRESRPRDPLGRLLRRRRTPRPRGARQRRAISSTASKSTQRRSSSSSATRSCRSRASQVKERSRAQEVVRPRPGLHPLPRRPPPGPPPALRPHLEHLAGPPDPRIRDPQVRRRPRPAERLRAAAGRHLPPEDRAADGRLPHAGDPPVVQRGHVLGDAPHPRRRVQLADEVRRSVPLPEDVALTTITLYVASPPTGRIRGIRRFRWR